MLVCIKQAIDFVKILFQPRRCSHHGFTTDTLIPPQKVNHTLMTKKELLAEAKSSGIKVSPKMNKEIIAQAINDER